MAGAKRSGCRFCELEKGAGSALVVHEDATTLAFLDRRPLFPGHCLVIPREHHETELACCPQGQAALVNGVVSAGNAR